MSRNIHTNISGAALVALFLVTIGIPMLASCSQHQFVPPKQTVVENLEFTRDCLDGKSVYVARKADMASRSVLWDLDDNGRPQPCRVTP